MAWISFYYCYCTGNSIDMLKQYLLQYCYCYSTVFTYWFVINLSIVYFLVSLVYGRIFPAIVLLVMETKGKD